MHMCCIPPGIACPTSNEDSFRLLLMGGQPPCSLQARFQRGTDRCSSSLCKQAPTLSYVSKFSAATPVGAESLRAPHEQPVCIEAKSLLIGLRLMLEKPICCCYRWVMVMSALKLSGPASRPSFLIT